MKLNETQVRAVLQSAMEAILGVPVAREADVAVVLNSGGDSETLADLLWDHWMGEPENPTRERVLAEVERIAGEVTR